MKASILKSTLGLILSFTTMNAIAGEFVMPLPENPAIARISAPGQPVRIKLSMAEMKSCKTYFRSNNALSRALQSVDANLSNLSENTGGNVLRGWLELFTPTERIGLFEELDKRIAAVQASKSENTALVNYLKTLRNLAITRGLNTQQPRMMSRTAFAKAANASGFAEAPRGPGISEVLPGSGKASVVNSRPGAKGIDLDYQTTMLLQTLGSPDEYVGHTPLNASAANSVPTARP